jgi:AcrR family transcriptional regulator
MLFLPKRGLRKQPNQDRSRFMVKVVLEAAETLFVQVGFVDTTTQAIADKAGVAIGSLYQYFDTKEALLIELLRARSQENADAFDACVERIAPLSIEEAVRALVVQVAENSGRTYALRKAAYGHLPPPSNDGGDDELRVRYLNSIGVFISRYMPGRDEDAIRLACFSLLHAMDGVLDGSVRGGNTDVFSDPAHFERIVASFISLARAQL